MLMPQMFCVALAVLGFAVAIFVFKRGEGGYGAWG